MNPVQYQFCRLIEPHIPCLRRLQPIPTWTTGYRSSPQTPLCQVRAKQWLANRKLFVRRLYKNVKVLIRPGEEISECVYVEGYYEPNQMYFLDHQLKPGAVFIDAGANDGLYTLFAAHKVGPQGLVISIEPSTREYEHLVLGSMAHWEFHLLLNGESKENWQLAERSLRRLLNSLMRS